MRSNTEEERSKAGRHRLWVDTLDHALHGRSLEDNHICHSPLVTFLLLRFDNQEATVIGSVLKNE